MDKEKWFGSWACSDTEDKNGRYVKGEFKAGIIPSAIVLGFIAWGVWALFR